MTTDKGMIRQGARQIPLRGLTHGDLQNDCWLNGKEAVIGYGERFAMVRGLTGSQLTSAEWAIDAARRIMAKDRQFKA